MDRGHRAQTRPRAAGRDREHQAGSSETGGLHGEQALSACHGHAGESVRDTNIITPYQRYLRNVYRDVIYHDINATPIYRPGSVVSDVILDPERFLTFPTRQEKNCRYSSKVVTP